MGWKRIHHFLLFLYSYSALYLYKNKVYRGKNDVINPLSCCILSYLNSILSPHISQYAVKRSNQCEYHTPCVLVGNVKSDRPRYIEGDTQEPVRYPLQTTP